MAFKLEYDSSYKMWSGGYFTCDGNCTNDPNGKFPEHKGDCPFKDEGDSAFTYHFGIGVAMHLKRDREYQIPRSGRTVVLKLEDLEKNVREEVDKVVV